MAAAEEAEVEAVDARALNLNPDRRHIARITTSQSSVRILQEAEG